jgi:hypothetical protein
MDKDLNDLLIIDQEIGNFYYGNTTLTDDEFVEKFYNMNYIDKALKKVKKLSGEKVLELLKRSNYLKDFIDLKKFLKPYKINKKYLKENKDMYIEEYRRLKNTCYLIGDIAIDNYDFAEYMDALDVDNTFEYLLRHMPNDQIYALANETNIWDEKLFYFSFLKK